MLDADATLYASGTDFVVRPVLSLPLLEGREVFTYQGAEGGWFVSDNVRKALVATGLTGVEFAPARVTSGRTS